LVLAALLLCVGAFAFLRDDLRGLVEDRPPAERTGERPFWEEDPESDLPPLDDPDWRHYADREEEEAAIARTIDGFADAMRRGDSDGSLAFILEDRREAYRELFSTHSEAMPSFGDVIASGEMSFLSDGSGPTPYNRIAEYAVEVDGFTFYVVLMKVGDTWVLYDF
jgi:hypothetical protein